MASWNRTFDTGSYTGNWHLDLDYILNSQNVGANTSNITLNLYTYSDSSAYSQSGSWDPRIYINGGQVAGSGFSRSISNGASLMASWTGDIGHNSDGTQSITIGDFLNAPINEANYAQIGWTLPTIPRYANITSFTLSPVTDEAITLNWSADRTCDDLTWWSSKIDGGAHHDSSISGAGPFIITNHNLTSGTSYDFTVGVRNAASSLWTFSSLQSATTLVQNKFFDTMGV